MRVTLAARARQRKQQEGHDQAGSPRPFCWKTFLRIAHVVCLIHNLKTVFFDDRIGENFLGNVLQLFLRFVARPAIEI